MRNRATTCLGATDVGSGIFSGGLVGGEVVTVGMILVTTAGAGGGGALGGGGGLQSGRNVKGVREPRVHINNRPHAYH